MLGSWITTALQGPVPVFPKQEGLTGDSGAGIWGSFNEQGDKSSPSNPFCPLLNIALEFPAMHSAREELMIQDVNILFPGSKAEHSFNPCPANLSSCQGSFYGVQGQDLSPAGVIGILSFQGHLGIRDGGGSKAREIRVIR